MSANDANDRTTETRLTAVAAWGYDDRLGVQRMRTMHGVHDDTRLTAVAASPMMRALGVATDANAA